MGPHCTAQPGTQQPALCTATQLLSCYYSSCAVLCSRPARETAVPRAGGAGGAAPPMHELSWGHKLELYRDGFTVLRGAVPARLVAAARAAIDGTGATTTGAARPTFEQINLNRYARMASAVGGRPEITDLFNASSLLPTLRHAIGDVAAATGAQIALTMPTEPSARCMQSGWPEGDIPHRGWAGHLDGVWNGGHPAPQSRDDADFDEQLFAFGERGVNGCARQKAVGGSERLNLSNYTALVGVSLSDQSCEGCGNLGLLRGAHHRMEEFFRAQASLGGPLGPGGPLWPRFDHNAPNGWGVVHYPTFVREAFLEGAAYTIDGKAWPKPTPVLLSPGDAVIALYHVPHNATRNEHPGRLARYQLYFRVTNARRQQQQQQQQREQGTRPEAGGAEAAQGAERALLDLWSDWEGLQTDLPRLRAEAQVAWRIPPRSSVFTKPKQAGGDADRARL
jgi:hypothetical protein